MEQAAQPGWYPDPEYDGYQRYWNGQQWTDDRASIVLQPAQADAYVRVNKALARSKLFNAFWFGSQMVNAIKFILAAVVVFALIVWLAKG
jgi:hypothetical protein